MKTSKERREAYELQRKLHWMALTGRAWETRSHGLKGTKPSGRVDGKHNS